MGSRPGCIGYLVQLLALALCHFGLAGKNGGSKKILPYTGFGYGARYHFFLGGSNDNGRPVFQKGNPLF